MIQRLRNKFVIINMSIVTVMLVVIFSLILFFMGTNMEQETQQMMTQIIDDALRPGSHPSGRLHENWRPNLVVRIDENGGLLIENNQLLETVDMQLVGDYVRQVREQETADGVLREEQLRYWVRQQPLGQAILFLDVSVEFATMKSLIQVCLLIGFLSFFVFLGLSFLLAKWAVGPVEAAWNQQRQFVADASHELKTPLTVIMTNAELLQSPEYEESQRSQFTGSILSMSYQMRGLVESLLELARVDNGTTKMVFETLDFSELVSECLLPFEPMYFERALVLESRIEEGLRVRGSASHLRQVVDILLDNASKYSNPETTVTVTAKRQGGHCLLSVASFGEDISREDLKNIFKRFYRIDKARAMNHSYGLGLAIADSVVKEHGGRIWAESENGVNTFCVLLNLSVKQ